MRKPESINLLTLQFHIIFHESSNQSIHLFRLLISHILNQHKIVHNWNANVRFARDMDKFRFGHSIYFEKKMQGC